MKTPAQKFLDAGLQPIPIAPGSKAPRIKGWQTRTFTIDDFEERANIGIRLGNGLVDVDLDVPEAVTLAPLFLPPTGLVYGRAGNRSSHWWYRCDSATTKWKAPDGAMLVELRSAGCQTLVPPSVHPSGESYEYEKDGPPGKGSDLPRACARLAACVLLRRGWPRAGQRHDAALALAGMLLEGSWEKTDAAWFVEAVAGEDRSDYARGVDSTADRLARGEPVAGAHHLGEIMGIKIVTLARKWLGISLKKGRKAGESAVCKAVALALDHGGMFHTPDHTHYARIGDKTERLSGDTFKHWLRNLYRKTTGKILTKSQWKDVLEQLESEAEMGPTRPVYRRIHGDRSQVLFDLGDSEWNVARCTVDGWKVEPSPGVFARTATMEAVARPVPGGSLDSLRDLLNLEDDTQWTALLVWLLGALAPRGPYYVLGLQGESGSAKTVTAKILRQLIDPDMPIVMGAPKTVQDLVLVSKDCWVLALDNLSDVRPWLSDGLCRVATGEGFKTRKLYSNDELVAITVQRPILLNGIDSLASRDDLADRTIILDLPHIPPAARRMEWEVWDIFNAQRGEWLGCLLDLVVTALNNLSSTSLKVPPRMYDALRWACAGLGPDAEDAVVARGLEQAQDGVASDPVLVQVLEFVGESWRGTVGELYDAIPWDEHAPDRVVTLGKLLRRAAPSLRKVGVNLTFSKSNGRRLVGFSGSEGRPRGPFLKENISK